MSSSKKWIIGFFLTGFAVFASSTGPLHLINNFSVLELREQFVYLTGVCGISFMVLSMILSSRFKWINKRIGGLDKGYVIHKWSGISALGFAILHWLAENIPHLLINLKIIQHPGELGDSEQFSALGITMFEIGTHIAEVVFYFFIILVAVALIKKFTYNFFRITHKFMPLIFLLLVYHAFTAQMKEHWMSSPAGYFLIIILTIGCIAAFISIFQIIGHTSKKTAIITLIKQHESEVLDIHVKLTDKFFRYKEGQYVFLEFEHSKESHPFTIASSDKKSDILRFAIKGLGDFTNELVSRIQTGQRVIVEGPYGEFHFEDEADVQIWIAGGIGITPFIARLEYLAKKGGSEKPIYLWYSTRGELDRHFPPSIQQMCYDAGVSFFHLNSAENKYLTVETLKPVLEKSIAPVIWFCGPEKYAEAIKRGLCESGFDKVEFNYDSFSMR